MKEKNEFQDLLKRAAISAKNKATRKNLPIAISENGEVVLIYPTKKKGAVQKKITLKKVP